MPCPRRNPSSLASLEVASAFVARVLALLRKALAFGAFALAMVALVGVFSLLGCVAPSQPVASTEAELATVAVPELSSPLHPTESTGPAFQPGVVAPPPASAGLTYEVYVRSFQDSDGDGIGDLEGLRSRLDYLADLGVRTIWVMPLFPSFGPAGYDVTDFDTIRASNGDEADLRAVVDDAHARGMRVILDFPLNHVHRSHPWFVDAESARGDDSADPALAARFVYRSEAGDESRWFDSESPGSYYAYFGPDMPDVDWSNPDVRDELTDIALTWIDAGADGYRLDAVLMLVEEGDVVEGSAASHAVLAELREAILDAKPDAFLLAEASEWESGKTASWLGTVDAREAHSVLDFPRRDALLDAVDEGTAEVIESTLVAEADAGGVGGMATFLGSHDVDRFADVVAEPSARRMLRVVQFLLPGDPVLYYGEELDLGNATTGTGQDYAMRAPMPWDEGREAGFTTGNAWFPPDPRYLDGANVAAQEGDPASMLSLVRALSCVRAATGLDGAGDWRSLATGTEHVLAFERRVGRERLVVAASFAATPEMAEINGIEGLADLAVGAEVPFASSAVSLPAWGFRVYGEGDALRCGLPPW